jgi:endoglucanase
MPLRIGVDYNRSGIPWHRLPLRESLAILSAHFALSVVLSVLLTAGLSAVAQADTAGQTALAVHVSGNHLVDGGGKTIQLRGANISGTEYACDQGNTAPYGWSIYAGQPLDQLATYQAMQAWGANVVRVPLNEDCWLSLNNVDPVYSGANYRNAIQTEVNLIHQAGLVAILDLHWTAPGSASAQAQNPEPDQDHSPAFWQSVAAAYKNDRAVIFELFNEPYDYWGTNPDPWAGWLNGDTQTQYVTGLTPFSITVNWKTAGMQELINTVRSTGATQPIMANGLNWANDMSGWLSHAPIDPQHQLIAGWHTYPGELCADTACWDKIVAPLEKRFPVVVTETGDSSAGPVTFLPGFFNWADAHGLSYLAWTWNPWQDPDNVLIQDWNGTPTAGQGAVWRAHLQQLRGSPAPLAASTAVPSISPTVAVRPCPGPVCPVRPVANLSRGLDLMVGLVALGVLWTGGLLALLMRRKSRFSRRP